jgi:phosphoribosyl 1,2-cyclic phosphodiesterase
MADFIKFLGTAGARFVTMRQLRSSAGVLYSLRGFQFLLDPGPGALVRCAASRPRLDPLELDALVLSHNHLDHSGDINVMIEAMTDGGFKKRGRLFCARQALEDDPVVLHYLRGFLQAIVTLEEGGSYQLAPGLVLKTPLRHRHPMETYGLRLEAPQLTIGHIVDTLHFERLAEAYAGSQVLILNVVRLRKDEKDTRDIQHLTADDARRLIADIRPRMAILTHFGMSMLRAKPWEVARRLAEETGVEVHAAGDGSTFQI